MRVMMSGGVATEAGTIYGLDEIETLTRFTVFLTTEIDAAELHALADVEGVAEVQFEAIDPSASAVREGADEWVPGKREAVSSRRRAEATSHCSKARARANVLHSRSATRELDRFNWRV